MSTIANAAKTLKDYLLKVDADNYEKHVNSVLFNPPSTQTVTWDGPVGTSLSDESTNGPWTVDIGYVQDWETADSLANYLLTNDGQTKTIEFVPINGAAGQPKFTADVVIHAGPIGGTKGQYMTSTVKLTCKAAPVAGVTA